MMLFFIIFISFSFPLVSAQVSDDYAQGAFSGYVDVLINAMVPLFIYLMVDYDFEEDSSKTLAQLLRSLVLLVHVGLQQELAFMFSIFKIPNFMRILQHIVIGLMGLGVIGNFIMFFKVESTQIEKEKPKKIDSTDDLENKLLNKLNAAIQTFFEANVKKQIQTLEEKVNILEENIETLEENVRTQIKIFEENVENKINLLEESVEKRIQILAKSVEVLEENIGILENNIKDLAEYVRNQIKLLKESVEKQIQPLEKSVETLEKRVGNVETKFQTLEEKFKSLEKRAEILEKKNITIKRTRNSKNCN
ncbi:hypothetical protein C1645_832452 [Glomus cerebriforme]|uniref:Uncharacterized protein n=1 Tax=Glomus cerebriforme TaxID=658196 RepID=A0A397SFI6_9GLOM|nr:hypothetical protein C1645_832452 [Glomus cerebriforme]